MEPTISQFTTMFAIATTGMLVLAFAIVFFVLFYQKRMLEAKLRQQAVEQEYQQKMLLASLESQESERRRIAGDLHDSIGAMLSAIRMSMLTIGRKENIATEGFTNAKEMIDEVIDSVRRISRDLMPSTLEKFGLSFALKEMCEQYTKVSGIEIDFEEHGELTPLDKTREVMIFRIAQEFINNSIKHAEAQLIRLHISWTNMLRVEISDNGKGFHLDAKIEANKGLGLFNMQNRARLIAGTIDLSSELGKGTKATLLVPIHP